MDRLYKDSLGERWTKEARGADAETLSLLSSIDESISSFSPEDRTRILSATLLAGYAHEPEIRKDGTPYVNHVLRVGERLIATFKLNDADAICAAMLHDVIENQAERVAALNSNPTGNVDEDALGYIAEYYGERVARLVSYVSHGPTPSDITPEQKQEVYSSYVEEILALDDTGAFYIKLSDFMDNTSDLQDMVAGPSRYRQAKKYLPVFTLFIEHIQHRPDLFIESVRKEVLTYLTTQGEVVEGIVNDWESEDERISASELPRESIVAQV